MHRSLALFAVVAALLCAPVALGAQPADVPRSVTIVLILDRGLNATSGHFTLSGALADSGVLHRRNTLLATKLGLHATGTTMTLAGDRGTITLTLFNPDAVIDV